MRSGIVSLCTWKRISCPLLSYRYLRIAKRFLLEQRLERILNGPVISSSSLPDFAKTSERGTSSPASLSTHPSSASSASTSSPSGFFEVSQSSSSSSSYFFGRSPAARLSPADLQDFFSHYWHEYQQQLLLVRQHQHHRNHGRGPGHPAALPSTSSGSAQSGRAGVGRAGGGGAGGGYYYLAGDLDRDDDGGATPAGGVGGVHDSDAAFVVKETASRPYWAIAQWHMLACEEISRAENHLQQLPHIREQQKELRQSILQLEQEQMSLLATRQKLLLTTRLHTPGRHESHPGDAKVCVGRYNGAHPYRLSGKVTCEGCLLPLPLGVCFLPAVRRFFTGLRRPAPSFLVCGYLCLLET